jgi:catechol 2,3-dioxygenase-like lactoylglutathione lyase family enzyme
VSVSEVAVFTDDVPASVAFYRALLGAAPISEWPGGAIFDAGGVSVLIHERGATMDDGPPNEDHFAVSVADLDAACATLQEQGVTILLAPREYPWGHSAYARDPDGRLVELAQS